MISVIKFALNVNKKFVDHAAMVIKLDQRPRDIYVLEVSPGEKVQVINWRDIKKKYGDEKLYTNISFRHLTFERTSETMEIITKFYL